MPFGTAVPMEALYASAAHKEAVARLRWLISARGLGALTGEVGCGKTVAVRAAVAGLDASRPTLIYLPNPQIGVRGYPRRRGRHARPGPPLPPRHPHPPGRSGPGRRSRRENRHVILAIDESHLLTSEQLEAVRMLTLCRDLDPGSPLTILLIGQPTLRRRLRVGDMAADQRIQLHASTSPPPP